MINGRNFFDQLVIKDLKTHDNIRKVATCQRDDYTTGCLLAYNYFKKYKMTAKDLSKQHALDADTKAMQQINLTGNLENQSTIFFIIEEAKKPF